MDDDPRLEALLAEQRGLVTRAQVRDLGLTPGAVRWALGRRWRLVLPQVIAVCGAPLDPHQRLLAALLHAGEGSMIAATSAAAWHGVTAAAGDLRVQVEVPMSRRPASAGFVVVRRTRRPDARPWRRGPLAITCRERAVIDAARDDGTIDGARAIVCEAVERRLVRTDALRHELEAGPTHGRRVVRLAVQDAEAGAWSVPEAQLLRIVASSPSLPPVWPNPQLTADDGTPLPTPDGWIDSVGLAVQVHSRRWHAGSLDWERTVMSDGVYAEYGIPVVAVTPRAIRESPAMVRERIERAYAAAARRPRPPVSARPSGHGAGS